ncbi:unnamed protein product [Nippostrongylus brasiliensis]|uniref:DUF3168 domain-containing protein n=1 Tax=Nippostrongylus brasiliensis TaxID=27835 RepID=A0A0N4Y837_NIPBR|nr:unnamed protein product [Nippostrongylus brasiliensis]
MFPYDFAFSAGSNDNEWIENPVFTLDVSPPVGWTFFPAISSDNYPIWYFVGQSNLSTEAKQRATAEIESSMLSALTAADMPAYGVVITHDYTPVQKLSLNFNARFIGEITITK